MFIKCNHFKLAGLICSGGESSSEYAILHHHIPSEAQNPRAECYIQNLLCSPFPEGHRSSMTSLDI